MNIGWFIALIVLAIVIGIAVIVISAIHWKKKLEGAIDQEISDGLEEIGVGYYEWKNEDIYQELRHDIENKIRDHRKGRAFKPRYLNRDSDLLKSIYKMVKKAYEDDRTYTFYGH